LSPGLGNFLNGYNLLESQTTFLLQPRAAPHGAHRKRRHGR